MPRIKSTAPVVVAVAVLLAYFNALTGIFQFDDYNVIVNNPAVHSLAAWRDSMPGMRPLLKISYALNWTVDAGPFGFHLFNVLVHAINAVLVYRLLLALREERAGTDWAPLVGALLFALHPVQTEAATYVSGRSVSLMALFYLGAVLAWLHADRTPSPRAWRGLSAGLFGAALLVKETAVTLPFALLLLDAVRARYQFTAGRMLRRQTWHWLMLIGGLLVMAASPTYRHLLDVSLSTRGVIDNLLMQANAVCYLAGQLLLPWRVNIDPDLPMRTALSPTQALQILAIIVIVVAGLRNLRRRAWLAFAVLWFFLHLLPTNSLLPRLDVANDRQLYIASIGVFFAVGIGVEKLSLRANRRWLVGAVTALVLLGLGFATVQRNRIYGSAVAFWEDAAMKSPGKPRVANNLGYAYQQTGRFAEAKLAYRHAIELDPDYWKARINLDALESAQPR
ncbi:MAG: tetratricopeptide repeat protein [Betaproteobacteria bacterium]|nr:tetratricopeptide repeat protein [Betaproteobacteria bacterium]